MIRCECCGRFLEGCVLLNHGANSLKERRAFQRRSALVLGHLSVAWMCLFALGGLFSCQNDRLGRLTDTGEREVIAEPENSEESAPFAPLAVRAGVEDFRIRALQRSILAFRGLPIAIPLEITVKMVEGGGDKAGAPVVYPRFLEVKTSDGDRILGELRWLSVIQNDRGGEGDLLGGRAEGNKEWGRDLTFPWVERQFTVAEVEAPSVDDRDGIGEGGERAYLVLGDGGDLATGLARIGDESIRVRVVDLPEPEIVDFSRTVRSLDADPDW